MPGQSLYSIRAWMGWQWVRDTESGTGKVYGPLTADPRAVLQAGLFTLSASRDYCGLLVADPNLITPLSPVAGRVPYFSLVTGG